MPAAGDDLLDRLSEPDGAPEEEAEEGAPAWVMTFADLMSLLMCFFVLLLSFSEIEATKFKQMAGAMRMAFGVQREVEATEIPKGTSIIAKNFSPGKPEPTPMDQVRQRTTVERPELERQKEKQVQEQAEALKEKLRQEIDDGLVDVETKQDRIVIRIREKGSFPSGSDELNDQFVPILHRIGNSLADIPGKIEVAGHTDDVPIRTYRFRSNWDLSAARAGSVLHYLLEAGGIERERVELKGLADIHPLAPNTTPANRAKNRRVEIVVLKGKRADGSHPELPPELTTSKLGD